MDQLVKDALWQQIGAAIDYLGDTLRAYPAALWEHRLYVTPGRPPQFAEAWYLFYHTLFWFDLYLTGTEEGYRPPAPFTLIEQPEIGPLPERVYSPAELLEFWALARGNCRAAIEALTPESAARRCEFGWGTVSFLELLIYNLRHLQEHTAELNLVLGQHLIATPDYPAQVRPDPA